MFEKYPGLALIMSEMSLARGVEVGQRNDEGQKDIRITEPIGTRVANAISSFLDRVDPIERVQHQGPVMAVHRERRPDGTWVTIDQHPL